MMAEVTVQDVFQLAQKLSPSERRELIEKLRVEPQAPQKIEAQENPFLALVGGWADMGDEGIDEFNRIIDSIRQEPGRDVRFDDEDSE